MIRAFEKMIQSAANSLGFNISRTDKGRMKAEEALYTRRYKLYSKRLHDLGIDKAHYGCGKYLFGAGWVNIDMFECNDPEKVYMPANLVYKHPFPSETFNFAFAEDFLEHLDQSASLIFLSEAFRTLRPGGVIRLSFPGLRGVLRRHYRSGDYDGASVGEREAYTMWGHRHFYCEESLSIVAQHIGFSDVEFVEYGESIFEELSGLDTREDQKDLNIYVELKKPSK
ncbi:MAG: methyltransferase domain-containing protein [Thermodesulfobacteriota bacterium]